MSRRLFIGQAADGRTVIRQALPGYDAKTAPLSGRAFDADFVPGREIGKGAFTIQGALGGKSNTVSSYHSLGKIPDLVVACATAVYDGNVPSYFAFWQLRSGSSSYDEIAVNNGYMNSGRRVTPFTFTQSFYNSTGGVAGTGNAGWLWSVDSQVISVENRGIESTPNQTVGQPPLKMYINCYWKAYDIL